MDATMSQLYSYVYASSARKPFSSQELEELLVEAREYNRSQQVSGMLVYSGGNFMQALEGTRPALDAVLQRVRASRRHGGVLVMIDEPISQRSFGDWDMAFRKIDGDAFMRLNQSRATAMILLRGFLTDMR